jgi:hypothetical protein
MPICYSIHNEISKGIDPAVSEIIISDSALVDFATIEVAEINLPYGALGPMPLYFVAEEHKPPKDAPNESLVSVDLSIWRVENHFNTVLLEPCSPSGYTLFHVKGHLELASRTDPSKAVLVEGSVYKELERKARGTTLWDALSH